MTGDSKESSFPSPRDRQGGRALWTEKIRVTHLAEVGVTCTIMRMRAVPQQHSPEAKLSDSHVYGRKEGWVEGMWLPVPQLVEVHLPTWRLEVCWLGTHRWRPCWKEQLLLWPELQLNSSMTTTTVGWQGVHYCHLPGKSQESLKVETLMPLLWTNRELKQ